MTLSLKSYYTILLKAIHIDNRSEWVVKWLLMGACFGEIPHRDFTMRLGGVHRYRWYARLLRSYCSVPWDRLTNDARISESSKIFDAGCLAERVDIG